MKIFISWSGDRSRQVAEALREWLQIVIQKAEPWVSTRDMDRGVVWPSELMKQLQEAQFGIACV